MSRVESIEQTRSLGRPATLKEARRALVNPGMRGVVLGSAARELDLKTQIAMAEDAHAGLDDAARASLARHLFVVDCATLAAETEPMVEDLARHGLEPPPFEVTAIFMPGLEGALCPLFVVTRLEGGAVDLLTAVPVKNDETFYWGVPGFAVDRDDVRGPYMHALLWAIKTRNLKPIGPPR